MTEMQFEAIDIGDLVLRCREVCPGNKVIHTVTSSTYT